MLTANARKSRKPVRVAFALSSLLIVYASCAEPMLDAVFRHEDLVLQANFKEDTTTALQARLFGLSDTNAEFKLCFLCTATNVFLSRTSENQDGAPQNLTNVIVHSIIPQDKPPFSWAWSGMFKCLQQSADVEFWIERGKERGVTNKAHLGDVWVIAGAENVSVTSTIEETNSAHFFTTNSPAGVPVVTCLPGKKVHLPVKSVPVLASQFAQGIVLEFGRPVETHTISVSRASYPDWFLGSQNWRPLFGWTNKAEVTIGTRGIIWWWGEWAAEYSTNFPNPLPNEPRASPKGWAEALADWETTQSLKLEQCFTNFTMMTSGPPGTDGNNPMQVEQLTLVVQLQGVNRQPAHANLFSFARNAASSWELFRAAQNQAVLAVRENRGDRADDHAKIRPRAAIVPASRSLTNGFPEKWFWEATDIALLATNLVRTASAHIRADNDHSFEIGLPQVTWTEKGATLRFGGDPTKMLGDSQRAAQLQYSTVEDPDTWVETNWSNPITIGSDGKTIRAVRYGAGNAPLLQYWIVAGTNEPPITIPAFEFFRPVQ
jgi:hypothetical protein